jgi:hypothetical protein
MGIEHKIRIENPLESDCTPARVQRICLTTGVHATNWEQNSLEHPRNRWIKPVRKLLNSKDGLLSYNPKVVSSNLPAPTNCRESTAAAQAR